MKHNMLIILLMGLLLSACGNEPKPDEEVIVEDRTTDSIDTDSADSGADVSVSGADEYTLSEIDEDPLNDPNSHLSVRIIYFAYDSSEVRPEFRPAIEAHANYLATHPDTIITLEGHTDERGSREYNLALGESRAEAVKRQMTLLGASAGQIRIVSYGEEQPAVDGHDENAWSQNRRVMILY